MITFIYALLDPDTDAVRYVGKSDNPEKRLAQHMKLLEPKATHKQNWLRSLASKGKIPKLKILEEVDTNCWQDAERKWIQYYRELGSQLTNTANGGEGGWNGISDEGRKKHSIVAKEYMRKVRAAMKAEHDEQMRFRYDEETRMREATEKYRDIWWEPQ